MLFVAKIMDFIIINLIKYKFFENFFLNRIKIWKEWNFSINRLMNLYIFL
jgi:hypothetical protein